MYKKPRLLVCLFVYFLFNNEPMSGDISHNHSQKVDIHKILCSIRPSPALPGPVFLIHVLPHRCDFRARSWKVIVNADQTLPM